MNSDFLYVPILQTKRGELTALSDLTTIVKDCIKPMLVMTQDKHTERSTSLAKNVKSKWDRPIYIDLNKVKPFSIQGTDFVNFVLDDLKSQSIYFTTVVDLDNQNQSIIKYISTELTSSCIRIDVHKFNASTLKNLIDLFNKLSEFNNIVDVMLDFGSNLKATRQAHAHDIDNLFSQISNSAIGLKISKIIIAGSSIPKDLQRTDYNPYGMEARIDWLGFYDFMSANYKKIKNPIFADYSISYPGEQEPVAYVNPNAKIRYTISDNYMFAVGYQVNTHTDGFNQYHTMSDIIVNSPYFLGANFSWGDKYLDDCSKHIVGCGNMETWVKVGHNHHISFVVDQIANHYGTSI